MKYVIKKSEAIQYDEHGISTFHDYKFPFKEASLGVSEIHSRYPQNGYDIDEEVDAYWYVEKGNAEISIGREMFSLGEGDMIHVPKGEKYCIDTTYVKLVVCSIPNWFPEQHKHLDI